MTKRGRVIVVTSGKGGVGKTTTSANIATGLALKGYKTVAVDFDIGLKNLDLHLGCERRVVYTMYDYFTEAKPLKNILVKDKVINGLFLLSCPDTKDKNILSQYNDKVEEMVNELRNTFDFVIIDSPAGIESGAMEAIRFADEAIVVCNPEISSIRDSDRIMALIQSENKIANENNEEYVVPTKVLITRYNEQRVKNGESMKESDISDVLRYEPNDLLGLIPEDESIINSTNTGEAAILNKKSLAGKAYSNSVDRLINPLVPIMTFEKLGFFKRMITKIQEGL